MRHDSDELDFLIRRAKKGDEGAFEELVRLFETKVFSIALKMTSNPHDAKDVAQETFLRVFRSFGTFDMEKNFDVWIAKIAVHCSYDMLNDRKRSGGASLDELFLENPGILSHNPSVGAEERLDKESALAFLLRVLPELPPQQRSALVLHDLESYESRQIAEILGCDESTVRRHLAEARAKLKAAYEKEFSKQ